MRVSGDSKTFTAGAALAKYRRVKVSASVLAYAGAADNDCVGVLNQASLASGDIVSVLLNLAAGTREMVASEAISAYSACYAAASGKVASTGTILVGYTLATAATADGDIIEVLPSPAMIVGSIARASLTQDDLKPFDIPFTTMRVFDAMQTNLPGTAAADDLALVGGTIGTASPMIQGVDFGGTSTTAKARCQVALPPEYVDGETITVRLRCAMLTAVSDGTATVDLSAYKLDGAGAVGSDLCATAAQSINSLTPANKDFTITPTGLAAGDMLDLLITIAGSDTGNLAVMIPAITRAQLLCDVKG